MRALVHSRSRGRTDREEALGTGRARDRHTAAITEETPLIPDRSADASRSLRFAGNTRAAAVGPAAVSARPRTPANPPEDARGGTSAAEAAARARRPDLPSRPPTDRKKSPSLYRGRSCVERERVCVCARMRAEPPRSSPSLVIKAAISTVSETFNAAYDNHGRALKRGRLMNEQSLY